MRFRRCVCRSAPADSFSAPEKRGDGEGSATDRRARDRVRDVTAADDLDDREKVRRLLQFGVERFGVENGHLVRIDPAEGTHTIVEVSGSHSVISRGATADLSTTYCRSVIAENGTQAITNAPEEGWEHDPAYNDYGLSCYLGAKVIVGDELYGTVCFVAVNPRDKPFREGDEAYVEFLAENIGRLLERKRREEALENMARQLEQTESLLHQVQHHSQTGSWEFDVSSWESFWTDEVYRILGVSRDQNPEGPDLLDYVMPEVQDEIEGALRRAVAAKEGFTVEAPLVTPEGRKRWVELQGSPEVVDGSVSRIEGTVRDITDRKKRIEEIRRARRESIERLARAAEYRDFTTGEHIHRVGQLARVLADVLNQDLEWAERLEEAAPLHDVGKIGIGDNILLKEGPLSDDEYERMKQHTTIGADLLSGGQSQLLQMAEQIARSHHERWDGTGYPDGRQGREVPLSARIVSVADALDAMTHDRPYRDALSADEAFSAIERGAGAQFDPRVTDAALEVRERLISQF